MMIQYKYNVLEQNLLYDLKINRIENLCFLNKLIFLPTVGPVPCESVAPD
jgi:hypothetical protein